MKEKILKNVRMFREQANLSQEQLADEMKITQSKYARFECGKSKTDLEVLLSFCKTLNKSLLEVITYPEIYVNVSDVYNYKEEDRVSVAIELKKDKREEVLKLIFGDNNLEVFKNE
ncbi:MAG: helix-turn-helix domain-containing protein [Bacteroidales bacterium]|nr:helix-turn-helix domain-containing protein [Bacteroidales bacterium]